MGNGFSPLPFKGGDQGVGERTARLDAVSGAARAGLTAMPLAPTPFPSLQREG